MERTIKWYTAVNEIAEAEGIEVADEDYENEAQNLQGKNRYGYRNYPFLCPGPGERRNYRCNHPQKSIKLVLDNAKIVEQDCFP